MRPTLGAELREAGAGVDDWIRGAEDPVEDQASAQVEDQVAAEAVAREADREEALEEGQAVAPMGTQTVSIVSKM